MNGVTPSNEYDIVDTNIVKTVRNLKNNHSFVKQNDE